MYRTKTLARVLSIFTLFCLSIWGSATFLTGVYERSPSIQASIPSIGMLYLGIFLFWFVLFLIPSWDNTEISWDDIEV